MSITIRKRKPANGFTMRAMQYYGLLTVGYVLLILVLPANHQAMQSYHLSSLEYRVLYFAIALPAIAVWFAAFYGYAKLEEYARSIQGSPEADGFQRLAAGCRWLAWSLPIPSLVTLTLSVAGDAWPALHAATIIVINYTTLGFSLIAFSIIGRGSRALLNQTKTHFSTTAARGMMLFFVVGGVLYCYLTFHRFNTGNLGSTDNPYFLPVWLLLLTIIIPYLYAWFVGLLATYELTTYSKRVRGVLYQQALHLLIGGLVMVIAGLIAVQYVSSVSPPVGHLALNYRLLLVTIFRVISGIGFALISVGALRLRKIEEV